MGGEENDEALADSPSCTEDSNLDLVLVATNGVGGGLRGTFIRPHWS